jgi:hypothetical protein
MTTGHHKTREEEAFRQLLEENFNRLSEAARTVVTEAELVAFLRFHSTTNITPDDYDTTLDKMHRAAVELTSQDREILAKICSAAWAAAVFRDPDHWWIGEYRHRNYARHGDYMWISNMIYQILL